MVGSGLGMMKAAAAGSSLTYINGVIQAPGSLAYPAGTFAGDLVIVVTHATSPGSVPTGFTSAFTTTASTYGYKKNVSYKIAGAETTAFVSGETDFDQLIMTVRGGTSVSASHQYAMANLGGAVVTTVPVAGLAVLFASDRGGSGTPSITTPSSLLTAGVGYFRSAVGIYPSKAAGDSVSTTDFNDTYNTSALLFVVL